MHKAVLFRRATLVLMLAMWAIGTANLASAQDATAETVESCNPGTAAQDSDSDIVSVGRQLARKIHEFGFSGQVSLVNDWSRNLHGGSAPGSSFERYSLDVGVALDAKKALGWTGSSAFARLKHHMGDQGGDYVGDAQGFSNIDAPPRTYLYELWFQQELMNHKIRIKGGKIDANSEFAVVPAAADFLNSSMGYSPTIMALPTYPEPQPGISLFVHPRREYQVAVGFFRTARAGPMALVEGGRTWSITDRELGGRGSLGFWHVDGPLQDFDGDYDPGSHGFYTVLEQSVWKNPRAQASVDRQITAFVQFGQANGEVSVFTQHLGGGLVLDSPLAIREHDSLGIAATSVRFTGESQAGFQEHRETAIELYYKLNVRQFLSLVPDVQYIRHPGGSHSPSYALVLTPRLVLSF